MHPDLEPVGEPDLRDEAVAERLRRLPSELAPPFDFAELQRRARAQGHSLRARRARLHAWMQRGLAAAAAAAVLVLAAALWMRPRDPERPAVGSATRLAERAAAPAVAVISDSERWLASLPADPAIVHVDTRLGVTDLEDRIASVDDLLTAARVARTVSPQLQRLQRERAQLVDSLLQVRYAETLAAQP